MKNTQVEQLDFFIKRYYYQIIVGILYNLCPGKVLNKSDESFFFKNVKNWQSFIVLLFVQEKMIF